MQNETSMTAEVTLPKSTAQLIDRYGKAMAMAEATIIDNAVDANRAANDIRILKARRNDLETQRDHILEPTQTMIQRVKALFAPALTAIDQAESVLRRKLLVWNDAEAARVLREKREAEDRQRAERQAAEAAAAETRRKAAEEVDRLASEAFAAAAAGDEEAAARFRETASAAMETAEAEASSRELEASASVAVVAAPAVAKGTGGRDNWKAEPITSEADVVSELVAAIHGGRRDLLGLLMLNMPACNALARASKANFAVPGMRAVNNRSTIIRS